MCGRKGRYLSYDGFLYPLSGLGIVTSCLPFKFKETSRGMSGAAPGDAHDSDVEQRRDWIKPNSEIPRRGILARGILACTSIIDISSVLAVDKAASKQYLVFFLYMFLKTHFRKVHSQGLG